MMKCPSCGSSMELAVRKDCTPERIIYPGNYYCPKCFYVGRGKPDDEKERRSQEEQSKSSSSVPIVLVLMILIWVICLLLPKIQKIYYDSKDYIYAGSMKDYKSMNYKDVVAEFKRKGFTNVVSKDNNDSGILFWTDDKVTKIFINGKDLGEYDEGYAPKYGTVIVYHH